MKNKRKKKKVIELSHQEPNKGPESDASSI